jgi:hypothetical protein
MEGGKKNGEKERERGLHTATKTERKEYINGRGKNERKVEVKRR